MINISLSNILRVHLTQKGTDIFLSWVDKKVDYFASVYELSDIEATSYRLSLESKLSNSILKVTLAELFEILGSDYNECICNDMISIGISEIYKSNDPEKIIISEI